MRELILDDMLPRSLAAELRARGRPARTLSELGLEGATDAAVAALDGVIVTTTPLRPHPPGSVALVRGPAREAVHRHAHLMAGQRPGSLRRYVG